MQEVKDVSHIPAIPIKARCKCGMKTLSVWQSAEGLVKMREHLVGKLDPDLIIQTSRCRHCKTTVAITARDLHLIEEDK